MKRKIAVITATRAEYGLLRPFVEELIKENEFVCELLVTGTHLLEKYGKTEHFIEKDGIPIQYKIPIMCEEENEQCDVIAKAMNGIPIIGDDSNPLKWLEKGITGCVIGIGHVGKYQLRNKLYEKFKKLVFI